MPFVNLHTHSHYSVMDGLSKVEEIAARVKALGQTAFAITDHGTISGLMEGYEEAQNHGLKYIFGVEAYFTPEITIKDRSKIVHLVLLAKNETGYYNLKKLISMANKHGFYYEPRVDWTMLELCHEGLIATSACMGGILSQEYPLGWAAKFKELFGEDFYIELHTNQMPEQIEFNEKALEIAQALEIPVLAAVDAHYITKADADIHRKWMGIKGKYYTVNDYYLMSEEEVRQSLWYLPSSVIDEAISNTQKVSDECNVTPKFGEKHYPVFPIQNQIDHLKAMVNEGWKNKIAPIVAGNKELYQIYTDRVNMELEVLEKLDYINYFLIAEDIVSWAKSQGIRMNVGRGSIGGSLVSYLIGITGIDPIKYNLVFERFANLERISSPDVDLDFQHDRRQEVIEYIRQKYGMVYQVRTFNYMGERGALQRAGQALGVPPELIDKASKSMTSLDDLIKQGVDYDVVKAAQLAKRFVGVIQSYGVHASAVVICPDDPCNYTAIEKQGENFVVAHDYESLEKQGLLKQDILGLKTLDVIEECIKLTGQQIDIDNLVEDDKKTFDMLCAGKTAGCFQIESQGMTKLVKEMRPRNYKDLIPLVALYRPGTLDSGMVEVFVRRRNGGEEVSYLHPSLEPILNDTYGIILYQEQTMEIAKALAGYTLGQADLLRRAIGKKKKKEMKAISKDFMRRSIANYIPVKTTVKLWRQIKTFANYGFNKAHSAEYGYTSYQTAYLKAHYPLEYMCALLNSEIGDLEKTAQYVQEAKFMGIEILPPNINKSGKRWQIEDGKLRIGLSCIKGVGSAKFKTPVVDFEDFMSQNEKTNRGYIDALILSGAFPGEDKAKLLARLDWWKDVKPDIDEAKAKIVKYKGENNSKKVAEWRAKLHEYEAIENVYGIPYVQPDNELEKWYLGFTLLDCLEMYDLSLENGSNIVAGEVIRFKAIKDKHGRDMAFVDVRTKTNMENYVMFSRYYKPLTEGKVYIFKLWENKITEAMEAPVKK